MITVTRVKLLLLRSVYNNCEIVFGAAGFVYFGTGCVFTCGIMAMYMYVLGLYQRGGIMINYLGCTSIT